VTVAGIKLTTYFSERDRSGDRFLADALFDVYERHQMRTSVLIRGVQGFGQHSQLQSDRSLTLSENLPAVSVAIDTRERVENALEDVLTVVGHGLISLERAQLATGPEIARLALPRDPVRAVKLSVYGGRAVRSGGQAGYVTAIELLRRRGAAGASVLLGVDGTLHGQRRRARFISRNAGVPLMLLTVGEPDALEPALGELRALVEEAVATVERVQVCKLGGSTLSEPDAESERDSSGLPIWQKLMIHGPHPAHDDLVRRLKEAGAAGATVLRGVRGFYGDSEPRADGFLSLRRRAPVVVVVVDRPSKMQRWWPLVDEATREGGLVTSELVPASHAFAGPDPPNLTLASTCRGSTT
jgi:PII-like signaling protein